MTPEQAETEDAEKWLLRAQPGSRRVYYTGLLVEDAKHDPSAFVLRALFGWASDVGLVVLVQRKLKTVSNLSEVADSFDLTAVDRVDGLGTYEYIAYRTSILWHLPLPTFNSEGHWAAHTKNYAAMGIEEAAE